ncbi:ketopantoate reductase family protein [Limobrevibacterium gyesilva]|uniref:2-dehydropantoate 2-reductase n=1 Tax=Limobrevibacterium gyesilva TaxID=2991712 RepID=A0AA41YXM3_9PROT|nr:2-dehydropantoate 2-reductase [Limobrevibacterium gyesilva]MCW3477192.1 2-dehydropantoate 2-reductase [Limobrevibacterium gyesilva]
MTEPMRIIVVGAGGLGGYFGGRLAQGGADVTFVARGAHLRALQAEGLRIESGLGDLHLPDVPATEDPAGLPPADLVMIAVKLHDTEAACRLAAPVVGPGTAVVSFQNGVRKDAILRAAFGPGRVFGGVGYIGAAIARPGVIAHVGTMQRLVFGEFDASRSDRTQAFLAACTAGGIDAELTEAIELRQWEKLVFLVGLSGATTTMRSTLGPVRENPASRAFLLQLMQEVVAVGRARGVPLPADYAQGRLAFVDGLPAEMNSSMHEDLKRGRRLELPFLAGDVVRMGQEAGVPTPANEAVCAILAVHAEGA